MNLLIEKIVWWIFQHGVWVIYTVSFLIMIFWFQNLKFKSNWQLATDTQIFLNKKSKKKNGEKIMGKMEGNPALNCDSSGNWRRPVNFVCSGGAGKWKWKMSSRVEWRRSKLMQAAEAGQSENFLLFLVLWRLSGTEKNFLLSWWQMGPCPPTIFEADTHMWQVLGEA